MSWNQAIVRKLLTAAVAASVLYILPAIGKLEALSHPQLWILVGFGVVLSIFQPTYKPIDKSAPEHDRGTAAQIVWTVYLSQIIGVVEAVYWAYPASFRWDVVTSAALAAMVAGLGLRMWAVLTLGRYFTWFIDVHDDHKVIRSGPFRLIRHPAYGGALILFVATLVFVHAWIAAGLSLVIQLFAYVRRIRHEETMMRDKLGDDYEAYAREVKALIPLVW